MRKFLFLFLVLFAASVQAVYVDNTIEGAFKDKESVRVIVMLDENAKDASFAIKQQELVQKLNGNDKYRNFNIRRQYEHINGIAGAISKKGFEQLKSMDGVAGVYLDRPYKTYLQEGKALIESDKVVDAITITGKRVDGSGEVVCVVDTGIDYTHSALGGCFGQGCKVIGGVDVYNNDNDPIDDNGHGTAVAAIIAGNDAVVKGVAPGAKLVAVKALSSEGKGFESDIVAGIEWCIKRKERFGITVMSLSVGGGPDEEDSCKKYPDSLAASKAAANGIFVAAAAGNEVDKEHISSPACGADVTSVGAVYDAELGSREHGFHFGPFFILLCEDDETQADKVTCYSNSGKNLDVLAPAEDTFTAGLHGNYKTIGGTSAATPYVSGSAALVRQAHRLVKGENLSPTAVDDMLKKTGDMVTDNANGIATPRINVLKAVQSFFTQEPCQSGDANCNGCIELVELTNVIGEWKKGNVGLLELIKIIGLWKKGC